MVLGAAGCTVLVRGDRDRRRIDISVAGPAGLRRSALNVVLDDLDEVHARNPEIGEKALVPLTDQPELDVSYEHLLKLEERYGLDHSFDPEDADRSYTVRELLEGVRRERVRSGPMVPDEPRRSSRSRPDGSRQSPRRAPAASILVVVSDCIMAVLLDRLRPRGGPAGDRDLAVALEQVAGGRRRPVRARGAGDRVHAVRMNPTYFYRRTLSYVIPAGLLLNAVGFTVDVIAPGGRFQWNGAVSGWFFAAWAVVVGCLVLGDLKQSR